MTEPSRIVENELLSIVADLDLVIRRCDRLGLPEITKRLAPIRDIVAKGIELRRKVEQESAKGQS
jgi:hypothetical protein